MKVLLVQPFKDFGLSGESYPPIGLGYLATAIRKDGHNPVILDCLKDDYDYPKFIAKVKELSPQVIGINLFSISVIFVKQMIDLIKDQMPNVIVVLGGPHVSSLPEKVLTYFKKADFAIRGEGEVPLRKLLQTLKLGQTDFSSVPGLIYRQGEDIKINQAYFAANIEDYGFPAWDLIKPQEYFRYLSLGPDSVPVFFSRGCPFSCTFCAAKVTSGQQLRRRGISHILEELKLLQSQYGIKRFVIEDEGFGVNKKFITDFCVSIKKGKIKAQFAFGVGIRLDVVDEELLNTIKEANFEKTIVLGIESGSERILKLMKKQSNLDLIWDKVKLMDKLGFEPNGYFILGYPSETRQEMQATINLALRLPIREASFTAFQPLPATEATNELIRNKELPVDYDFTLVSQNKVVYAPLNMTPEELEKIRKRAILRFYLRPRTLLRYFRSLHDLKYAFKKLVAVFFKDNLLDKPRQQVKEESLVASTFEHV